MTTLYIITRFLTFPGALIRTFIEHIICRTGKIVVEDNRSLRNDELCSHIEHELLETSGGAFAICFVPMLVQLILAFFISMPAVLNLLYLGAFSFPLSLIDVACLYIGFALLVNCFPSIEDALNMMEKLYKGKANILQKIIFAPGAVICYIGAYLERYCVTILTSVALVAFLALKV